MNRKALMVLAVAGVAIWVFAPQWIGAALPLLIVAICPLSMLFMMKAMNSGNGAAGEQRGGQSGTERPELAVADDSLEGASVDALRARLAALEARQAATADQLVAHDREGARRQADA
ncbi:MAG: DUF2933 domain-containing protein [Actinomycetota bacterium]|nr:DUF2933 domain-containing protein [Actinomycetota bacterium]